MSKDSGIGRKRPQPHLQENTWDIINVYSNQMTTNIRRKNQISGKNDETIPHHHIHRTTKCISSKPMANIYYTIITKRQRATRNQ